MSSNLAPDGGVSFSNTCLFEKSPYDENIMTVPGLAQADCFTSVTLSAPQQSDLQRAYGAKAG